MAHGSTDRVRGSVAHKRYYEELNGLSRLKQWKQRKRDDLEYCSTLEPKESKDWGPGDTSIGPHGGIFGLDFSTDGRVLGVACEHKAIMLMDPLTRRSVAQIANAHESCVNTLKFLDTRMMASCSDDQTIVLWDIRNLKQSVRRLVGHESWVKNIEFVPEKGLLISSGFDGYVSAWNLNEGESETRQNLFHTPGLMRMKLTPQSDKMIISTQWGYLLLIHNLNLDHLQEDLEGFKPNIYWLTIKSGTIWAAFQDKIALFENGRRNQVEIIQDFPFENDPENITSITPHPQGWVVLSRNTNHTEDCEWTCVHDIQMPPAIDDAPDANWDSSGDSDCKTTDGNRVQIETSFGERVRVENRTVRSNNIISVQIYNGASNEGSSEQSRTERDSEEERRREAVHRRREQREQMAQAWPSRRFYNNSNRLAPSLSATITDEPSTSGSQEMSQGGSGQSEAETDREDIQIHLSNQDFSARFSFRPQSIAAEPRAFYIDSSPSGSSRSLRPDPTTPGSFRYDGQRTILLLGPSSQSNRDSSDQQETINRLIPTHKRLLSFIQEPHVGRGFIKEQAFSNDGRLIASPFAYGVRLLAFDPLCRELCDVVRSHRGSICDTVKLHEVKTNFCHQQAVLCTKFSPTHCNLLVASYPSHAEERPVPGFKLR